MSMSTLQSGLSSLPRVYKENGIVEFRNSCRATLKGSEKQVGGGGIARKGKENCSVISGEASSMQERKGRISVLCYHPAASERVGSGTWVDALVCLGIQTIGPGRRWETENMASRVG